MILKFVAIAAVLIASIYLVTISICIVSRMTWKTPHVIRLVIVVMAGVAFTAVMKTITNQWAFCAVDVSHILAVLMCAVTMLFNPRISV